MYEDMEPLFANPVLPLLAIALTDHAFRDYRTFEEIEAIPPPADRSLHHLRIKKEMLHVPIFQIISAGGPTGKIHGASSFSNRTVDLGHRAGYEENIGIHDIRREALVKADGKLLRTKYLPRDTDSAKDNGYSTAERMKFAGHNNADTFFDSYAPELSTVDGMASYWNKKRRTIHLEGFRGLSLHHHPQLLQSLPAKVEANLESCADFVFINKEIEMLGEKLRCIPEEDEAQSARARREELYWRKRQLVSEELNKWQQIQPRKIASNTEDEVPQVASLPSYFDRIRRLDPPRDRLASSLFLNDPLRSVQGRSALQDMITLCEENPRVAYRPSLRPKDGHCPVPQCEREMDRFDYPSFLTSQIPGCRGLANQKPFNSTASIFPIDGNIFIVATRATWNGNTALPSFVFSAMNGSLTGLDGLSTVNATSPTSRHSQFNAIHLSSAEPLLLPGSVSSVSSIRGSRQRNVSISFLSNRAGKSICKNISGS